MKKLCSFFLITGLFLFTGCSEDDQTLTPESQLSEIQDEESCYSFPRTIVLPYMTNFTVYDHSDRTDRRCGEKPINYLTMKGEGWINLLGKISTEMSFCHNGSNGFYYDTEGYFLAANGDKLEFTIPEGQIFKNEVYKTDYYQFRFDDKMYFIGGTGRFEDASGWAMTNAFVHNPSGDDDVWHTDFFSKGYLKLPRGKQKIHHF